jgi:hypothetical protein
MATEMVLLWGLFNAKHIYCEIFTILIGLLIKPTTERKFFDFELKISYKILIRENILSEILWFEVI